MVAYKTKYFTVKELVHPWILKKIGAENAWLRLDEGCLRDLDRIRKKWGGYIYINSGPNDSRGYRPPNDPDGAWLSVHKHGKAFDLVPANGDNAGFWLFVFEMIKNKELEAFNTLESRTYTSTWTHVAKMNTDKRPLIIKP